MKIILIPVLAVFIFMTGCQSAPHSTLYQDLGELQGIESIVNDFLFGLGSDPRIAHHFAEADPERLRSKLVEQFCAESGGGCTYTGDSMKDAHAGMNISHADFNALVEVLIDAMEKNDISVAAQNRLLQRLAPMHRDIVEQ